MEVLFTRGQWLAGVHEAPTLEAALKLAAAFDAAGVRYFLGGSVASALYGEARSTRDVDLVAALLPHHVEPFLAALGNAFYADATAIGAAVAARRSFNVIHLDTMVKADIFIFKADAFGRSQFARRIPKQLSQDDPVSIYVASAEDTVLAKLQWYRQGGAVSDRQWTDVLGVLKVQGTTLDRAYLEEWARELGLKDLLRVPLVDGFLIEAIEPGSPADGQGIEPKDMALLLGGKS